MGDDDYTQSTMTIRNAICAFKRFFYIFFFFIFIFFSYLTAHIFLKIDHIKKTQSGKNVVGMLSLPSIPNTQHSKVI